MIAKSVILTLVGLLLVTFNAVAGTSVLEGFVKDPTGRPVKGADVRVEAKNFSKTVKTDASGRYRCDGLAVGTYKVILVVGGQVKAQILNGTTRAGKPSQFNFNLTGNMAPAKKHTHMVYVAPDIGTHIGGGRWVEVDDNGNPVGNTGSSNVQKVTGTAVQSMQLNPKTYGGR